MKPTRVMQHHGVSRCRLRKHLFVSQITLAHMSWHQSRFNCKVHNAQATLHTMYVRHTYRCNCVASQPLRTLVPGTARLIVV